MEVSVIVIAYNEQDYIKKCLTSILNQTFSDFELLVIDDCSTDQTASAINSIQDERIRYIRNDKKYGVAGSRNVGLRQAKGEYVFFTDADCMPIKYWLEEGLKILKTQKCIGVEGITFYATAKTTISDRVVENAVGGNYATRNIAYTKEILDKLGGFDVRYNLAFEDQDLALRTGRRSEIIFSEEMIVIHQRKKHTIRSLFLDAKRAENVVHFIKNHQDCQDVDIIWWRILYPKKLLIFLCPFLLIPYHSFRSWQDVKILPFIYFNAVYLRFIVWKAAIKERILLI